MTTRNSNTTILWGHSHQCLLKWFILDDDLPAACFVYHGNKHMTNQKFVWGNHLYPFSNFIHAQYSHSFLYKLTSHSFILYYPYVSFATMSSNGHSVCTLIVKFCDSYWLHHLFSHITLRHLWKEGCRQACQKSSRIPTRIQGKEHKTKMNRPSQLLLSFVQVGDINYVNSSTPERARDRLVEISSQWIQKKSAFEKIDQALRKSLADPQNKWWSNVKTERPVNHVCVIVIPLSTVKSLRY